MIHISVIIPVYNAATFLEKAVQSALKLEEVKEILLIEDGSTDGSLELCKKLASGNSKIKLFQHSDQGNHGAASSRNLGLEKASQEFVAFLDADDYYLQNRFEAENEVFKNEEIEGVFGAIGTEFLSDKGKEEFERKFKNVSLTTLKRACEGREIFRGLIGLDASIGSFFHLNGLTIRKKSLERTHIKFNEKLRVHQDSDFITKLSYHCYLKSGMIEDAIAVRGVHDDNRITKIKPYSKKFYENMLLVQQSLFDWSKTVELDPAENKQIKLNYWSFKTANEKGIIKYFSFIKYTILNFSFAKMRYRFHALNQPQ